MTCTRPDALPAGQPYPPITVNATVADPAPATVINTATVAGGGDIDDSNNSATDAGGATAQADLTIAKVADQAIVPARGEVTFTLDVANRGPSTATAVEVADTLAPNFEAIEVTSSRGSCTDAGRVRARRADAGADRHHHDPGASARRRGGVDGHERRDGHGHRDQRRPVAGNNSAEAIVDVPVSSDLQVDKSFAPAPNPTAGDLVTYTVT